MKPLMLNTIGKIRIGREGPHTLGIFATRSPYRPNPIGLSTARILAIDEENGIIQLAYLDADEGSEVLDLKP